MNRLLPVSHYPTGFRVTTIIADYMVSYMFFINFSRIALNKAEVKDCTVRVYIEK